MLVGGWKLTAAEAPARAGAWDAVPADYVPDAPVAVNAVTAAAALAPAPLVDAPSPAPDARFGPPLDVLRVTSSFGLRRHPILGFTRMHQGVDFAAPEGAPVLAAADGVVTEAGRDGGYGNLLRLRHAGGWETGYAHLLAFAPGVAAGTPVARGQVVGFVGATGLATGPHLHYEVSLDGVKLDPMKTPFGDQPTLARAVPASLRLRPAEQTDDFAPRV